MDRANNRGCNPEHFQKIMGTSGVISSSPKQEQSETEPPAKPVTADSPLWKPGELEAAIAKSKALDLQLFDEAKPCSLYGPVYFGPRQNNMKEDVRIDPIIIDAYKRGDRVGAVFEGGTVFQPVNESRLELALKNHHGTDESSIVDCFIAYVKRCPWNGNPDSWLWGWLVYHQEYHGRGYGRTMKDHFSLIKYLVKRGEHMLLHEALAKVLEIAADANSFGNGSLCLVYPLYQYAKGHIGEYPARDVVLAFTRCTHANTDAIMAVNLLMDLIDGRQVDPPGEKSVRENCFAERPTAYNTLLTAMFIADVDTEMEVIRRGVWVSGDTDSTLSTAMLLWALKQ